MVSQRDIVLISFQFSNLKQSKPRPVVVVSNDNYNKTFNDFVAIPLTSNLSSRAHTVSITNREMESGTLLTNSLAKVDKIASLDSSLIIKKIGRVKRPTFNQIKQELDKVIF